MTFNKMANLISGGIDYMYSESEDEETVEKMQDAEDKLYELTNLLEAYGVNDIEALKNVFKNLEEIRMVNPKDAISKVLCSPVIEPTTEQAKEILKNCGILDENYNIAEDYKDIFVRKESGEKEKGR